MKNKGVLLGGIAVVVIAIAAFMFVGGGGGATLKEAQEIINTEPRQAIALLQPYTKKHPKNAEGWLLLGDAYKAIEEYGMPTGDKKNAVLAYWEGFKLGNDECRRRLAWETCPLVTRFMEGNDFLSVGYFTDDDLDAAYKQYKAVQADRSKSEQEKQNAELWLKILVALKSRYHVEEYYTNNDIVWINILETKPLTDDDYLAMLYVFQMHLYWEFPNYDKLFPDSKQTLRSIREYANEHYKEEMKAAFERGKQNKNPLAIEIEALQMPCWHWSLPTVVDIYDMGVNVTQPGWEDLAETRKKRIELLEPIRDKLTNNGKLLLAEAYSGSNPTEAMKLIKESLKGPYALSAYPEMAFTTIFVQGGMPDAEFQKMTSAIQEARYTEAGGQWKDIFAKAKTGPRWDEGEYVMPLILNPAVGTPESMAPWLMTTFDFQVSFSDDEKLRTSIKMPVRYNSLKDEWEPILGLGLVKWETTTDIEKLYVEYRKLYMDITTCQITPYIVHKEDETNKYNLDQLPQWAMDILKPESNQAIVSDQKL